MVVFTSKNCAEVTSFLDQHRGVKRSLTRKEKESDYFRMKAQEIRKRNLIILELKPKK